MARPKTSPATMSDDDLRTYILDTVERLKLLTERLEKFAEERHAGEPGTTDASAAVGDDD